MTHSQESDETPQQQASVEDGVEDAAHDATGAADGPTPVEPATPAAPTAPPTQPTPAAAPAAPTAPQPGTPRPTPAAMRPRPAASVTPGAPAVAAPPAHTTSLNDVAKYARVEDDGHVFLLIDGTEHAVGQYPDATKEEALAYFVRKFDDVASQIALLEQRVAAHAPSTDMRKTITHLKTQVAERHMVGNVLALEARLDALGTDVTGLEKDEKQKQDAARASELATREAIVAEAEQLAAKNPATVQWKTGSARMNELFDAWKLGQKNGPRLGRSAEDSLWKRFRSARTVFDRHRRAYFSQLDSDNAEAKTAKEKLIAEAEALTDSTDWGHTAGEYRRLMDQWKASKRAGRKDDDALWARFRGAQDKFFAARKEANEIIDNEYSANLSVKEELLAEARRIDPSKDLPAAKKALQGVRDRWEEAGKVPRADMARIDAGLRAVEEKVKAAEDERWQRTNPETQARTNSALTQLESAIASLEDDLAAAEKSGDAGKIRQAREALAARQEWLDMLRKTARNFG